MKERLNSKSPLQVVKNRSFAICELDLSRGEMLLQIEENPRFKGFGKSYGQQMRSFSSEVLFGDGGRGWLILAAARKHQRSAGS